MAAANPASVSPTDTPGAADAIPITVSGATPIASGSRRGSGVVPAAEPGSADLVLSIFGAFSFTDQLPLLDATARVLSPGGRLAITLRADDHHDTVVILRRR